MSTCPASDPSSDHELVPQPKRTRSRRLTVITGVLLAVGIAATSVAIPRARSASLNRNESTAIATLKNISSAQSQTQAYGAIDANGNGQGEYGYLAEMAATVGLRGTDERMQPPVLSAKLGTVKNGRVEWSGYYFQMFLPGMDGHWIPESAGGGVPPGGLDADKAEVGWCCYAWPVVRGVTGNRAFVITHTGNLIASNGRAESYSGHRSPPAGLAGFAEDGGWAMAVNRDDVRGNRWVVV